MVVAAVVVVVVVARVLHVGVVAQAVEAFGVGVEGVVESLAHCHLSQEWVGEERACTEEIYQIWLRRSLEGVKVVQSCSAEVVCHMYEEKEWWVSWAS